MFAIVACNQVQNQKSDLATEEPQTSQLNQSQPNAQATYVPALQPKDHMGRWEEGNKSYETCLSCHDAEGDKKPVGTQIPKSHFETDGTLALERSQCFTCHPVAQE